jgi:hypothetical protein
MRVRAIRVVIVIVAMMGPRDRVGRWGTGIVMGMDMDMEDMIMGIQRATRKGKGGPGVQMRMRGYRKVIRVVRVGEQRRRVEGVIKGQKLCLI